MKKKAKKATKATTKKAAKKTTKKKPAKKTTAKKTTAKKTKKKTSKKKKVLAIPAGYHSITPYLIINDASRAIEFYKKAFGAKEEMRMEHNNGKVGHAELKIGNAKIMLADEYPEMDARAPSAYGGSPVSIHLYIENVDNVVDRAVHAGAKVLRPIEDMYYGDRSCALQDPYGHRWYVSTHVEDVSPAETKRRADALFGDCC